MAAVQRNLLDGFGRDDVANARAGAIDERHLTAYEHCFRRSTQSKMEITDDRTADVNVQRRDVFRAKAGGLGRDDVGPSRDCEDVVPAFSISAYGAIDTNRIVADANDRGRKNGAGRVEYAALKRSERLRADRQRNA